MTLPVSVAILDVDGTLVDTNYHHALAWYRAFRQHGVILPLYRIHRAIGMGSDHLIPALAGDGVEADMGEDIRSAEKALYLSMIEEVEPLEGARDLILDLKELGLTVVLASSAKPDELDHYLDLLDARDLADSWTSAEDVERTKPDPDLIHAALDKSGGGPGLMIGDSTWDCEAAGRAGIPALVVLTGGFSEQELRDAGAVDSFDSVPRLRQGLKKTLAALSPSD